MMRNDVPKHPSDLTHQRCIDSLPWFINGTLAGEEAELVKRHVENCATCALELRAQRNLLEQLRDGGPVLMAPQSAWQKMTERLDAEDELVSSKSARRGGANTFGWRWAVAAQALVIVALGSFVWIQSRSPLSPSVQTDASLQPRYQTLTSASDRRALYGDVRVVFRRDVTLAEVNGLLGELSAQIVAGPSEAGVYTLQSSTSQRDSMQTNVADAQQSNELLKQLRADSRVVFAEPNTAR